MAFLEDQYINRGCISGIAVTNGARNDAMQNGTSPNQAQNLINVLGHSNAVVDRLLNSVSHLGFKFGIGGPQPAPNPDHGNKPVSIPSLQESATILDERLTILEKMLGEIHVFVGER